MMSQVVDSAVFPGIQGGPLEHVIAAKAVAFGEALRPEFKQYGKAVLDNARILADTLVKGGWIAKVVEYPVEMAQNFWTAIFAFSTSAMVTIVLSLLTKQLKTDTDLKGLVYSLTPKIREIEAHWYKRSSSLAVLVLILVTILTILFW